MASIPNPCSSRTLNSMMTPPFPLPSMSARTVDGLRSSGRLRHLLQGGCPYACRRGNPHCGFGECRASLLRVGRRDNREITYALKQQHRRTMVGGNLRSCRKRIRRVGGALYTRQD